MEKGFEIVMKSPDGIQADVSLVSKDVTLSLFLRNIVEVVHKLQSLGLLVSQTLQSSHIENVVPFPTQSDGES